MITILIDFWKKFRFEIFDQNAKSHFFSEDEGGIIADKCTVKKKYSFFINFIFESALT